MRIFFGNQPLLSGRGWVFSNDMSLLKSLRSFGLWWSIAGVIVFIAATGDEAKAGVFDLASFDDPGDWSVGLEPELILGNQTGAGINLKPRYGANDLMNIEGVVGTGSGARRFRLGGIVDFEWFPDYEKQPGIATPVFLEYYRTENSGVTTLGVKPMLYKTFGDDNGAEYTPFIAFPMGWNVIDSTFHGFTQLAIGSLFCMPDVDHWKFTLEAGFDVNNSYSYISGGITFFR